MSAVRQFRAEGERPLKVPSPPALTAVFTGVGGRALHTQGMVHELQVSGTMIVSAKLDGGGGEGLLLDYCVDPVRDGEVEVEVSPGVAAAVPGGASGPLTHPEPAVVTTHPTHFRVRRCCFRGATRVPPIEQPGKWDVYLTVQNLNHVPDGTEPVIAARVIGGHVLSATAEVLGCGAVLLSEYAFDVT